MSPRPSRPLPGTILGGGLALLVCSALGCAGSPRTEGNTGTPPGDLITDRPDRTESSATVAPGFVQVEWGWSRMENDDDGVDVTTDSVAETLVRTGLVEDLELRVGFAGFIAEEVDTPAGRTTEAGAGDGLIGFKWRWLDEGDALPELAILGGLTLPTGAITSERADPSILVAASKTLTDRLGIAANTGISWETEEVRPGDDSTLSQFDYSVATGAALTGTVGGYVEWFGNVPLSRDGGPENSIATGVTWLLAPNLQLDLSGGLGVSDDADDHFVAIGFSYRFPR